MADFEIQLDPGFEDDIGRLIAEKANEAVAAVGAADGRSAAEIATRLDDELTRRGVDLPQENIDQAAGVIASGRLFEFRG